MKRSDAGARERAKPPTRSRRGDRPRPALFARAVGEAVNVFDGERGCLWAPRKDRYASVEAHIRIGYAPKQGFDELVNALAGLAREIGESYLERGVYADRGVRHRWFIVPRRRPNKKVPRCGEGTLAERVEREHHSHARHEIRACSACSVVEK